MRRVTVSFGISLAIVCLLMTVLRASLLAGILVSPGLLLSSHLIPKSAWPSPCSDSPPIECLGGSQAWMYFNLVLWSLDRRTPVYLAGTAGLESLQADKFKVAQHLET